MTGSCLCSSGFATWEFEVFKKLGGSGVGVGEGSTKAGGLLRQTKGRVCELSVRLLDQWLVEHCQFDWQRHVVAINGWTLFDADVQGRV